MENIEETVKWLKETDSNVKVIVFSFDPPSRFKKEVLKAGADGYINRPLDYETVIEAIKALED